MFYTAQSELRISAYFETLSPYLPYGLAHCFFTPPDFHQVKADFHNPVKHHHTVNRCTF
jgi:hypothetical protein